jgi:hypothetical protein
MIPPRIVVTTLETTKSRSRKRPMGRMGSAALFSNRTNRATRTAAIGKRTTALPPSAPAKRSADAIVRARALGHSMRLGRRVTFSWNAKIKVAAAARPTGTLT